MSLWKSPLVGPLTQRSRRRRRATKRSAGSCLAGTETERLALQALEDDAFRFDLSSKPEADSTTPAAR